MIGGQAVRSRHGWRVLSYSLFAFGSYFGVYAPSELIEAASNDALARLWYALFAVSVTGAIVGTLRGRLAIEYASLPLLSAAFLVYAICVFSQVSGEGTLYLIPAGCFIGGISAFLGARFWELHGMVREVNRENAARASGPQ